MSIFRTKGFDSVISKGTVVEGDIIIAPHSTLLIEGIARLKTVTVQAAEENSEAADKTTLMVAGSLVSNDMHEKLKVNVTNVVITGHVCCDEIRVPGVLAIKKGAQLIANKILYRRLVCEEGAILRGNMISLDHSDE